MKILDSDHCVAILRGKLDLQDHAEPSALLAVTSISVGELVHGAYNSAQPTKNLARLDVLLTAMVLLPFNDKAARNFGRIRAELEKIGQRLSDCDLQIAGIALALDVPLVTHNLKHFQRIPDLTLEDWLG